MSTSPIIEIANVEKSFGPVQALSNINLAISNGEIITLLGPSGCGKTTLMRLIAGFEQPSAGSITIDSRDVSGLPPERRPVNMVFQRYALFPHLDVFDNVAFGLKVKGLPAVEIRERVTRLLRIVQLDSFGARYIDELSGGQSQRVALARALVNEPKVLLLDEPLAALDLKIRQHMLVEMKRIHAETGATFIYVTHDQDEAMILSDRVVLMERGRIVQVDRPDTMYAKPQTLFAAKFLGETNLFDARIERSDENGTVAKSSNGITFHTMNALSTNGSDAVTVSIRPEAFSFDSVHGEQQYADGIVEDVFFIGGRSLYTIRIAGDVKVKAQTQRRTGVSLPPIGGRARLFWHPGDVVMLSAEH